MAIKRCIAEQITNEERASGIAKQLDALWRDAQYGARLLYSSPGLTIACVLTLALGIGANTAIFSVVNAALLTPIPIPEPDHVVMVWTEGIPIRTASGPDFLDWQASGVFETLAGFTTDGFNLLIGTRPEHVQGASVTPEWFEVQHLKPIMTQ